MKEAFYTTGFLLFLFAATYFAMKCVEWNQKRIADKYQTNQHHFLSDLYKIQVKWSSAGEFGYAESIGNVIKFHGNLNPNQSPGSPGLPLTNDAASTELQLRNLRKEEMKEFIDEYMTEFKG